jgi:hypothetical protein
MVEMRALVISQYLPPLKYIAAVRISEVANQFAKNGYEVIGFSTNNHQYLPTDQFKMDERIVVHRSNSWDFLIIRLKLKSMLASLRGKKTQGVSQSAVVNEKRTASSWKSKLFYFLANYLPFSLVFGEGSFIYIIGTFFKALRYAEDGTVVFTSFRPYSDHIIGYLLKLFRPRTIWICDFRDPHLPPNASNAFFGFHAWINRRMCRRADVVTTVSKGVARNLEGYNKNISILRNGIVGTIQSGLVSSDRPDKFNLIYTGGLYNGTRNPLPVFRALSELIAAGKLNRDLVRIVYAGGDKAIWDSFVKEAGLESINESYGMLSMEASRKLQQSAAINLLLTWSDRNYKGVLTGKMYEYFKARRPIITVINGDRDEEIEEIMAETNAGPVVYNDGQVLVNFIRQQYEHFLSGEAPMAIDDHSLRQFQWDHYFPQFLTDLNLINPKEKFEHAV